MSAMSPVYQLARIIARKDTQELFRQYKATLSNLMQYPKAGEPTPDAKQYSTNRNDPLSRKPNPMTFLSEPFQFYQDSFSYNWIAMTIGWYQNHRSFALNVLKSGIEIDKRERSHPPTGPSANLVGIRSQITPQPQILSQNIPRKLS